MPATHPYIPRVAVIFDFDRTLATDTIEALCKTWGIDRDDWESRYADPLGDGWDNIIRRGQALIACGQDRDEPLSQDFFARASENIELYDGVRELKTRLEDAAREMLDEVEVEMIVLSSGYLEMIERTEVNDLFDRVWAGAFHYDDDGKAKTMKRIIGHPEKAIYIESYAKGLDLDTANEPQTDSPDFDPQDMHVPFDQLIYVGDGLSDLDSFAFVGGKGGLALAVNKSASFDHADQQTEGQRVENLAAPDYSQGAEMLESLCHAVRSCAARAALRRLGDGE